MGLILFVASWASPLAVLLQRQDVRQAGDAYSVALIPGLCMALAAGSYMVTPFHASWMSLWLPLALLLARLCERPTAQPPLR